MSPVIEETRDYNLLATLNEEVQALHHFLHPDIFKPYDKNGISNFFKSRLEEEHNRAFIVKQGEKIVAYAFIMTIHFDNNPFQYERKYLLVDQIMVSEGYRGKGFAQLLLQKIYSFATESGMSRIELNHWSSNAKARSFFTRNGFEYFNERMCKQL